MKKLLLLTLSVALLGAGCSSAPTARPSTAGPTPSIAVGEPNPSAPSGTACTNAYFPAQKGFAVSYKTNFGNKAGEYKTTVTDVRADGLSVQIAFPDNKIVLTQDYTCDGPKLMAKGYADFGSALAGTKVTFETKSQDGLYLPERLVVGTKWDSSVNVVGKIEGGPLAQAGIKELKESITTKSEALAKEKITVAAGTFEAIKVKQDMTIDINMGIGTKATTKVNTTTYVWFAEGIGMVKSETASNGTTSTVETVSIQK